MMDPLFTLPPEELYFDRRRIFFQTKLPDKLSEPSEDFTPGDELLALLLRGAARRGYSDPADYLAALVESDQELKK
jgi:hypothetical protein